MRKLLTVLVIAGLAACGSDDAANGVEATVSSIQTDVFSTTCNDSGCHNSTDKAGSLDLSSDAAVRALVGVDSAAGDGFKIVDAGDAKNSSLVQRIKNSSLGSKMPLNKSALPADVVAAVETWINDGAK